MKLILKDKTEFEVNDNSSINRVELTKDSYAAVGMCDTLTKENLSEVQIGDLKYSNMIFSNVTATTLDDGKVNIVISIRERTKEELLLDRIAALEKQNDVQDSAIEDLGSAVSDLSEGK